MRERPYALRFRPDTPQHLVSVALDTWLWRWHMRGLPGRVAWSTQPRTERDSEHGEVHAYHLRADAEAWAAFRERGTAITVDDVVARLDTNTNTNTEGR